jgi:hypothetical protein
VDLTVAELGLDVEQARLFETSRLGWKKMPESYA